MFIMKDREDGREKQNIYSISQLNVQYIYLVMKQQSLVNRKT